MLTYGSEVQRVVNRIAETPVVITEKHTLQVILPKYRSYAIGK